MEYYKQKLMKYIHKSDIIENGILFGGNNDDPLFRDCYIASSHNTYLEGNQVGLTSNSGSNVNCYRNFLMKFRGGCVEIDIGELRKKDDGTDDIIVTHDNAGTGNIFFSDIMNTINDVYNNLLKEQQPFGPIIISFDHKKTTDASYYNKLGDIINKSFNVDEMFCKNFDIDTTTLSQVRNKILIKWKCITNVTDDVKQIINDISNNTEKSQSGGTLLINKQTSNKPNCNLMNNIIAMKNVKSISYDKHRHTYPTIKSIKQNNQIIKKVIKYNTELYQDAKNKLYVRSYPPGVGFWDLAKSLANLVKSDNYPFITMILYGVQMVALNAQRFDEQMLFMMKFFETENNKYDCIRVKPDWLRFNNEKNIDPNDFQSYQITFTKLLSADNYYRHVYNNIDDKFDKMEDKLVYIMRNVHDFIPYVCIKLINKQSEYNYYAVIDLKKSANQTKIYTFYQINKKEMSCENINKQFNTINMEISINSL